MTRLEQLAEALRSAKVEWKKQEVETEAARIRHRESQIANNTAQEAYIEARGNLVEFAEELGSGCEIS